MIAKDDTGHGHDNEDNGCPGCRFRTALAAFLTQAHRDGAEEWYMAVGDLKRRMLEALLAIEGVESLPFDDDGPDMPFERAADAIANVGVEMQDLWSLLMDPGTGM